MSDLYVNALPQTGFIGGQDVKDEQPEAVSGFPPGLLQEFKTAGEASAAIPPVPPATSLAIAAKDVSTASMPSLAIQQKSQLYLQTHGKNGGESTIQKRDVNDFKTSAEENQGVLSLSQRVDDRSKNVTLDKTRKPELTVKPDDWLKKRMKAGDRAAVDGMTRGGTLGAIAGGATGVGFAILASLGFPALLPWLLPCVLLLGVSGAIAGYLSGRASGAAERHVGEYKMSHSLG